MGRPIHVAIAALAVFAGSLRMPDALAQTTPPATDGGRARHRDAGNATASDGGACSIEGTWAGRYHAGRYAGATLIWHVDPNGLAEGTVGWHGVEGEVPQLWALRDGVLSLTDVGGSERRCAANSTGTYTLSFGPGCATVTLRLIADPCPDRASGFGGAPLARR